MLDAKPLPLAEVRPAVQMKMSPAVPPPKAAKPAPGSANVRYRIQLAAESTLEGAQRTKAELESKLGGSVDVDFDAPYYKLRWGYFESRQQAQDKLLELSKHNLQGFVIKQ